MFIPFRMLCKMVKPMAHFNCHVFHIQVNNGSLTEYITIDPIYRAGILGIEMESDVNLD